MQLSDVVEVIEAHAAKTANELLGKGWKLVTVSTASGSNGQTHPCYVLARDSSMPPLEGKAPLKML
jgi:hypothetical protein